MTYNGKTFNVLVEAGIHSDTGQVYATFQSIDPNTELPPDVLTGFLPPEDGTGRGDGHISYTVQPKVGLATGTEIRNVALITFDQNAAISTDQVDPHDPSKGIDSSKQALVTIDAGAPSSHVTALASTTSQYAFQVQWGGQDDANGSGIAAYDIYVSDNGGAASLWQSHVTATDAGFTGLAGHRYAFTSVAIDNVGNRENKSTTDTQITLLDTTAATSHVIPLPAFEGQSTFPVTWSGQDDDGGSGIASYDVYVSDNHGAYSLWQNHVSTTTASFAGVNGHTYAFFSVATDTAANRESKMTAETQTTVDTVAPASHVLPLAPFTKQAGLQIQWTGQDGLGESGIGTYDIYVIDNGGSPTLWLDDVATTSATFAAQSGHIYGFYSVATDLAGHTEAAPVSPNVTTAIDLIAPSSAITAVSPSQAQASIQLSLHAQDEASGVAGQDIFVSVDGAQFQLAAAGVHGDSFKYLGQPGHTYAFYSVATDGAGNVEAAPQTADTTISTSPTETKLLTWKSAPWSFFDADGTPVTVKWTGAGSVTFERFSDAVTHRGDLSTVVIDGSNGTSGLSIVTKGGGRTSLQDLVAHGAMKSIAAGTTDLLGNLTLDGSLASLTLGQVTGGSVVKIGARASGDLRTAAALTFGHVADLKIDSATPLASITAMDWLDLDGQADTIVAPSLGKLTTTGGSMAGNLVSTGALGGVAIHGGDLTGDLVARSFGAVTIAGGGFSGSFTSTTTAALLGKTAALTSLNIIGGDFTGDLNLLGAAGAINIVADKKGTGGALVGSLLAAGKFGAITTAHAFNATLTTPGALSGLTVKSGGLAGTLTVASVGPISSTGSLSADITASGAIGTVKVTAGVLSGDLVARSFGAVSVTGGNFSGSLTSLTSAAALNRIAALTSLSVTGGDIVGDVRLMGGAGAISANRDTHGAGGNFNGATITALKIASIIASNAFLNSTVLAGADLGADYTFGGTGAGADTFGGGSIGAVKIGGAVTGGVIAAGLSNIDGIIKSADDTILGGSASSIGAFAVGGPVDVASYFVAGKFLTAPKIARAVADSHRDPFKSL